MSEAPAWFTEWASGFAKEITSDLNKSIESGRKALGLMDQIITRIDSLEARVARIENGNRASDTTAIRAEISSLRKNVETEDNCEVLFSGIPHTNQLKLPDIAEKTLSAIGLSNLAPHVIGTRKWLAKPCIKQSAICHTLPARSELWHKTVEPIQCPSLSNSRGLTSATKFCAIQRLLEALMPTAYLVKAEKAEC